MGRARQAALKEFQENGIEPWTIDKLYSKDENSGRVEFKNPDDPQHPFASRAEAQSWVDAMNSQIKSAFQQRIEAHGREFAKEEKPKVELIRFLPKYQKLDKVTREVFDGVVDQFKIVKDGNVVGFGCDLDAALKQTEAVIGNLTKITRSQAQTQTETPPAAEAPALDMKSGGGSGVSKEPATLAEALKMTYEQDAEKGKKK